MAADDEAFDGFASAEVEQVIASYDGERVGPDELRTLVADTLRFRNDCRHVYEVLRVEGGVTSPAAADALEGLELESAAWEEILDALLPSLQDGDGAQAAAALESNCRGVPADPARVGASDGAELGAPPS